MIAEHHDLKETMTKKEAANGGSGQRLLSEEGP